MNSRARNRNTGNVKVLLSIAVLTFAALVLQAEGSAQDGLLFRASFDSYNTAADKAAGSPSACEGIDADLQFRMHPGVMDGKGNALALSVPEYVAWPAAGNIHPDRGTVSLWVRPCNYTLADGKTFQIFFQVEATGFQFYIYKYAPWSNRVMAYMRTPKERHIVCGSVSWKEEEWHKLDVAWDPNRLALYIDGRRPARSFDFAPDIEIFPPAAFPKSLSDGIIALGYPKDWNPVKEGRVTAFDDLEIRDKPMSSKDVFEKFAAERPDLAKVAMPVAEDDRDPVKLTYRCIPHERKLDVKLDFDAVELPCSTNIHVRMKLADKANGEVVSEVDAVFADSDATADVFFGDRLKSNHDYVLTAAIKGTKYVSRASLRVPDMELAPGDAPHAGVDHIVPRPWVPVRRTGELTFSILDRTYSFEDGVIPSQIESRGQSLFARRPFLELNGASVAWEKPRLVSLADECATLEASGHAGGLSFRGHAELWFDGFCKLTLSMCPSFGEDAKIDSLRLKWSTPGIAARYLMTPGFTPWNGNSFERRLGLGFNDCSLLWMTGVEKGLAWWRESEANWVEDGQRPNLRLARKGDEVDVEIDVIARTAVLCGGKTAVYVMGFQGTPARRPDHSYRVMNYGDVGSEESNWRSCGHQSNSKDVHPADSMRGMSLVPMRPAAFGSFLEQSKRYGLDMIVYAMPAHICTFERVWDYWYDTWVRPSGATWPCFDESTGDKACLVPCCAHTGAADLQLANAKKLFEDFPLLKGLYFDIANVEWCDNELHGHGGTDAFGRKFRSSIALSLREFFMRAGKICRAYGRWLHVHAHNKYFPFVHDFADACWPGEEKFYSFLADPRHFYIEGVSEEEYQCAWNPEIRGMGVFMIAQNARAKSLMPDQVAKDPDGFFSREAVRRTFMPSVFYDFKCMGMFGKGHPYVAEIWKAMKPLEMDKAIFHPEWVEPVVSVSSGIRTALYTWRKGDGKVPFLLALGNFSREGKPTGVKIDWIKVGTSPTRLVDIESGRSFSERELSEFSLRSHDFLLLTPEARP